MDEETKKLLAELKKFISTLQKCGVLFLLPKFNSLLKKTQNEEKKIMLGQIKFENFKG